jgi:hypothetical protein
MARFCGTWITGRLSERVVPLTEPLLSPVRPSSESGRCRDDASRLVSGVASGRRGCRLCATESGNLHFMHESRCTLCATGASKLLIPHGRRLQVMCEPTLALKSQQLTAQSDISHTHNIRLARAASLPRPAPLLSMTRSTWSGFATALALIARRRRRCRLCRPSL